MPVILLVAAATSHPVAIELEGGAGLARPYEDRFTGFSYALAPIFHLRAGVDLRDRLGLSVSLISANGGQGSAPAFPLQPAFAAWAALATIRFHSAGDFQVLVEGGLGPGHLIRLQTTDPAGVEDHPPFSGTAALAWRVAAGVRGRVSEFLWLGADLSLSGWNGVVRPFTTRAGPAASDLSAYCLAAMLSLTFRSPL
jgi:hypothetical protein